MGVMFVRWVLLCMLPGLSFGTAEATVADRALSVVNIPNCGLRCLFQSVPTSSCELSDTACVCHDAGLQQAVSTCMVSNCTMADNLVTARVNKELCGLSSESRTSTVVTYTTTVYIIALTCVGLRVAGRYLSNRLAWNDAPVVAAVLLAAIPIGTVLAMSKLGFGEHLWNLEDGRMLPILRYFYIAWSTYVAILGLIKTSLILFYMEIFTTRRFRICGWIVLAYIVVNSLIIFLLTIFACKPVQSFWNRDLLLEGGKCMDIQIIGYANSVSAIVQDIILVVLPLFFLRFLHMNRYRKIAVGFMFVIGSFGCITTIIRLHTLLLFKVSFDPTWDYVPIVIWTELEITACFVCVSLPSIRVLVMRLIPATFKDWLGQVTSASRSKSAHGPDPRRDLPPPRRRWRPTTWGKAASEESLKCDEVTDKGALKDEAQPTMFSHITIVPGSRDSNLHSDGRKSSLDLGSPGHSPYSQLVSPSTKATIASPRKVLTVPISRYSIKRTQSSPVVSESQWSRPPSSVRLESLNSMGCLPDRTYSHEGATQKKLALTYG